MWKMLAHFATGEYRAETYYDTLSDERIGEIKIFATITTEHKESFGRK